MPRARGSRNGGAVTGTNRLRYQVELQAVELATTVDDAAVITVVKDVCNGLALFAMKLKERLFTHGEAKQSRMLNR